ncbi:DNA mismatch repair endonuclease MutL [Halovenus salina]|uniref:DNA mismatch repair endonuclease MutL n=1 Tax=Halovenus salina TaxID=1510225 RepID=A0ABD5VVD5_9EURY
MTASEIRELDPQTVERIAAGEVVERPASVVKELVENSIDADASRVTVAVENGGIDGISVRDDGYGMERDELERAVEKHTTSKIRDIDDLESGVATLGFRGEALHAIGAVSRLTITTRPRTGGEATELTVEGGEVTAVRPAGHPPGTTVEIEDLFYNVPARRKYLKQPSTEFDHVNTVATSYGLANPDVAVALEHEGRETFATTGSGDLQEAVMAVYGREVAEAMRSVSGDGLPEGPLDSVGGLVSHPETNRASREYLSTFVNGRYVTASVVREAIVDAYDTQLAPDRYPFAVLFLSVDPATVDVNVHPRKLEVRFADEDAVKDQVEAAVEQALLEEGLIRSKAPVAGLHPNRLRFSRIRVNLRQSRETTNLVPTEGNEYPRPVTTPRNHRTQRPRRLTGRRIQSATFRPARRLRMIPWSQKHSESGSSRILGHNRASQKRQRAIDSRACRRCESSASTRRRMSWPRQTTVSFSSTNTRPTSASTMSA